MTALPRYEVLRSALAPHVTALPRYEVLRGALASHVTALPRYEVLRGALASHVTALPRYEVLRGALASHVTALPRYEVLRGALAWLLDFGTYIDPKGQHRVAPRARRAPKNGAICSTETRNLCASFRDGTRHFYGSSGRVKFARDRTCGFCSTRGALRLSGLLPV